MDANEFVNRVFQNLPTGPVTRFDFKSWRSGDRPTSEGFGLGPVPGADPEKLIARVMDVDRYVGNVDYVAECRSVADPAYVRPQKVRFYQRIGLPVLGDIQMELALVDLGVRDGWRVAAWSQIDDATRRLDPKRGARSAYNVGCWIVKPGVVGYALSSAPAKEDVGMLKYAAMTKGADASAPQVVKANIEGMARWASRS